MTTQEKLDKVNTIKDQDTCYQKMLMELRDLEKRFLEVVDPLPTDQNGIIWDYIMYCEDMSQHVLELACTHMNFSEKSTDYPSNE